MVIAAVTKNRSLAAVHFVRFIISTDYKVLNGQ